MMFSKGITIVAITKRGVETALKIKDALTEQNLFSNVFTPEKYKKPGVIPMDEKLYEFVQTNYGKVDAIIAVMAVGIIIRAVAPCLKNKLIDPAVIGVDASGRFVVSLLSGHYGGANELTKRVAEGIGATPVVTTASDVMGKQSADDLARILHLKIVNPKSLVGVNSAIVNDRKTVVVLVDDARLPLTTLVGFDIKLAGSTKEATEMVGGYDAGIVITNSPLSENFSEKPIAFLKPFKVTVGLGARKEIHQTSIIQAVQMALARVNLPLERVDRIATVSIKKNSTDMLNAAKKLGLQLEFVELDMLNNFRHQDLSPESDVVRRHIGVGGVSEQVALIAAGERSRLIQKKMVYDGVTVAIAEGE